MKKLFATLCALCVLVGTTVSAATSSDTTYTEKFVKKHTQKVVNKEKELTNKANSAKAKHEANKAAAKKKHEQQKAAVKKKQAEQQAKLKQKKDAIDTLKKW